MSNEDLTGRSQLTRNVSASYAGHLVFIIFGAIPLVIASIKGWLGVRAVRA